MFENIPDFDYKTAYKELRQVFDAPHIKKALLFAAKHPELVYGQDSEEYKDVVHGYFSLYCSIADSNSAVERT